MTFLPIVDRELRVAARRRSTYRIRTWTTVLALAVGSFWFLSSFLAGPPGGLGKSLYTGLTAFVFGLCLLGGTILTADCLSVEKREGTLGLLFLTDLRGYDVVLGKFMAMSLNAVYGLLAILPVTGLCLLLGGLTAAEVLRMNLALLNGLFFSLAAGTLASAFERDAQRAVGEALVLVVFFTGGLPALGEARSMLGIPSGWEWLAWISPYYPFSQALEPRHLAQPERYWWALAFSQLFGWLLLLLAGQTLPRRWQERSAAGETRGSWRRNARRTREGTSARAEARAQLLPVNPVFWLMSSEFGSRRVAWLIVGAWGAAVMLATLLSPGGEGILALSMYGVRPFGFLLKWLLALQACHFFVEARRNGALEMLLCTPLTSSEIIRGQVLALRRNFQWPVLTLLLLLFVPAVAQSLVAGSWNSPSAGTRLMGIFTGGAYCLRMLADCYALGAFGMWLALTLKKPGLAPSFTILFVLLLPSVLCWLDIFADLFFILWGVSKLNRVDLRSLLAREYVPVTPLPTSASAGVR